MAAQTDSRLNLTQPHNSRSQQGRRVQGGKVFPSSLHQHTNAPPLAPQHASSPHQSPRNPPTNHSTSCQPLACVRDRSMQVSVRKADDNSRNNPRQSAEPGRLRHGTWHIRSAAATRNDGERECVQRVCRLPNLENKAGGVGKNNKNFNQSKDAVRDNAASKT